MPADVLACRVAIAGASSLRGKELKQLLEGGSFPAAEIRLFDEEFAVGTLTEAAGEATLIQSIDEESFERVRFVFFAGTPAFSARHWEAAERAGATVIDLSGGLADLPSAQPWIPPLDSLLPPPAPRSAPPARKLYLSPAAPTIAACSLAATLSKWAVQRLALVFFQPVSECGQAGIEELESQTIKLLSFQPIAQEVFDAQVAFNLLDRYGPASVERLSDARLSIAREVRGYLAGRGPVPAIQLIQAPVFYSYAFTAYAELASPPDSAELLRALEAAGAELSSPADTAPSNVSVAGGDRLVLGQVEADANVEGGYWFWGAADNLRLPAANAVRIAEKLLAS
ncbi:MAG TPA: Asd/ArgC dimerization domain-containing protein [Candidatus Acidoferrales bacterium]|nr:Asd/ArgC dimerization domain-containing protein [Candidatus Acidoferrales bacterium]